MSFNLSDIQAKGTMLHAASTDEYLLREYITELKMHRVYCSRQFRELNSDTIKLVSERNLVQLTIDIACIMDKKISNMLSDVYFDKMYDTSNENTVYWAMELALEMQKQACANDVSFERVGEQILVYSSDEQPKVKMYFNLVFKEYMWFLGMKINS